jgi:hypothetical protein
MVMLSIYNPHNLCNFEPQYKNQVKNVFKIGDRVSFLDSKETGLIEKITNERMAVIKMENGLLVPHLINNLVPYKDENAYNLKALNFYDEFDAKVQRNQPKSTKQRNNVSIFTNDEMVVDLAYRRFSRFARRVEQWSNFKHPIVAF